MLVPGRQTFIFLKAPSGSPAYYSAVSACTSGQRRGIESHYGAVQEQSPTVTELRWLHELRMRQYRSAATTLQRVAATGTGQGLGQAQRAACLTKLALLADQPGGLVPLSAEVLALHPPAGEMRHHCMIAGSESHASSLT